jgi:hypothetical protein
LIAQRERNSIFFLQILNSEESKHWRRRAIIKWCILGDENTKFFHTMATYRYRKNKIKVICHNQQEFFADSDKIAIATNYFANLFKEDRRWISNIDLGHLYSQGGTNLQDLGAPFTWHEIERAINNAPSKKKEALGLTISQMNFINSTRRR